MYCPQCDNPIEKDAQFCPKCFAKIEAPSLWRRLLSIFTGLNQARLPLVTISKTVSIKSVDPDGTKHEYHSLAEAPPELQAAVKEAESELMKEGKSTTEISEDGIKSVHTLIREKKVSVYKIKDASGTERTYHSLEELPPEIQEAFKKAQQELNEQP